MWQGSSGFVSTSKSLHFYLGHGNCVIQVTIELAPIIRQLSFTLHTMGRNGKRGMRAILRARFLSLYCAVLAWPAFAEPLEDLNRLHEIARAALLTHLQQTAGGNLDTEVKMLPLDARLRLAACDDNVDHQVLIQPGSLGSATVKLTCTGSARWTLFAPAQIAVFGEAAVAAHNIDRGSLVQPGDIRYVRQNLSALGANYIDLAKPIIGLALKRSVREGEVLRLSQLEEPKIIQRGDRVMLEAQSNGLSVAVQGTAMANGKLGERIQVKNTQSNQLVDAQVVGPGRVRVTYR